VKRGFEIRFKDGLRCASDQATSLARGRRTQHSDFWARGFAAIIQSSFRLSSLFARRHRLPNLWTNSESPSRPRATPNGCKL